MCFVRSRELTDLCRSVIRLCFLSGSWRGEGLKPCAWTDGSSIPSESRVLPEDSHIVGAFADWRGLAFEDSKNWYRNYHRIWALRTITEWPISSWLDFQIIIQGKSPFLTCLKSICKIIFAWLGIRAAKHKSQICLWFFSTDLRIGFENLTLHSSDVRVYLVKFHRSDVRSDHRAPSLGRLNNSLYYNSYFLFPFWIVI
jgi:hypothetical protein